MRRILTGLAVCGLLLGTLCFGQSLTSLKLLKQEQKRETKKLKLKEKSKEQAMKNLEMPKAMRTELKHQMAREIRALKQKQKDQRQELKDQERFYRQQSQE